jgi:alkanesulfonate monooxygenase SsuD/methylene tetrahydromethanopterin reductase-like flavin-dependent oxidoreductase (luciferase family)
VAVMKRVWSGEKITESVLPVGPSPVQAGGPPLFVGSMGPKTIRSAAAWADGLAGTTLDLDVAKQNELFDVARAAWAEAGKSKPQLVTSFWFAFGPPEQARAQVHRHLRQRPRLFGAGLRHTRVPMRSPSRRRLGHHPHHRHQPAHPHLRTPPQPHRQTLDHPKTS